MNCGLLGRKLGHSYSPQIHQHFGAYAYHLFEKEPAELEDFFASGSWHGLNVTIPYKKDAVSFCNSLSPQAKKLGAVNTVIRKEDGTIYGHNTDYFGFSFMLKKAGISVDGKKALVLGSGGASATAQAVLKELGAQVIVISRSGENNYGNVQNHWDASLIVNATPVGMYPNNGDSPLSLDGFHQLECVLDLIYNPARTALLLDAQCRGIQTRNGLWMLVAQAKESAELFADTKISVSMIEDIYNDISRKSENIILIGMPGCGKSTVGRMLSEKLSRFFIDADEEIIKFAGKSIGEIFADGGEDEFRSIETQVLREITKASGAVIATGGGCVTRPENIPLLGQNGRIYYIEREFSTLPTDGRPLSQNGSLEEMFGRRKPLYERFADRVVQNNTSVQDTVDAILKLEDSL